MTDLWVPGGVQKQRGQLQLPAQPPVVVLHVGRGRRQDHEPPQHLQHAAAAVVVAAAAAGAAAGALPLGCTCLWDPATRQASICLS